ncbi:hypothetical protein TorRG33x02_196390 [Trema orientale]|uniref:Uncharacterized protein n=1 Tax=Trema orientale TaxID=63057 RepID=A0A2P5EGB6_TREOI|nr:hypothetical protein TorRG33x02_196390 [Trema orientale]
MKYTKYVLHRFPGVQELNSGELKTSSINFLFTIIIKAEILNINNF